MSVQIAKRREGEWRATVDGHKLATIRRTPFGFEITNWKDEYIGIQMSQIQAVDKVKEIYWSEA
jgi:hypothetical protein